MRKYYEAYDERYKTVHEKEMSWFTGEPSGIVTDIIAKYKIDKTMEILEIGCGEGRDAKILLQQGYHLLATDVSEEAIKYCKKSYAGFADNFCVLDCVREKLPKTYDLIYAVAVVHMLLLDEDRKAFYQFIYEHLTKEGIALICTMGDGETERQSDMKTAFELQERECRGEKILVAGTSCRMVSFRSFEKELTDNDFIIQEKGITSVPFEFSHLMYAVVKKK